MSEPIICLKNLKKYYGKSRGIEDVSLKINKGEIFGFLGPNGAGKSTTIRTIMGLINKTSGQIYIKGKEIDKDDIAIKKIIGYLPSETNLYNNMSVKQVLNYHQSFYEKDFSKRRNELCKLLKIDLDKKIEDLSLGNLKKIGIVLALMHEPEILILDEATSGLDPIMQNIFHDILMHEKEKGTTILYSSHVLSEVSNLCDRVGFIKDGRIIKEDYIALSISGSFYHKQFILLSITPIFIGLPLFAINLFISTFLHKTKKTIGISLGMVFIFYLLNVLSELSSNVEFLKYFSIYTLADVRNVISNISINPIIVIVSFLITLLFISLTYIRYNKKELIG